jgi:alpha-L-rhamnosidase
LIIKELTIPSLIQRKDGSIFALCRNSGNIKKMIETESYDRGKTWKPGTLGSLPNPAGGFHMIRLKSGNVAIIYNHAPAPNNERKWRNPLSVALSEDDGKTWKYRRNLLEWHPDEQGDEEKKYLKFEYPTITQGADGKIHATWSLSHLEIIENEKQEVRFTDIQYTSFSEEWIKEHGFFENAWEL